MPEDKKVQEQNTVTQALPTEDSGTSDDHLNQKEKRKRRITNFPTTPYEESLEIANAIWKFASGQRIRRLTLFDNLERSPDSGPSRALVTASSKYKITTGSYSAEFLELTSDGAVATNPEENPIRKLEASFKLAIGNNEYFSKLYENYKDMRLPIASVMSDFLCESGLPREECDQCVEIFIVNGKYIGLIDVVAGSERIVSLDYLKDKLLKNGTLTPEKPVPSFSASTDFLAASLPPQQSGWEKTCFFIAPIGDDGSEERLHSDLFLGQIVEPVLNQFEFRVVRADKINSAGMITSQIIEHIIKSEIVVADLSFHNPNVFYELSLRHAQNKPTIHIIRKCDKIPFDINTFRTITIDDSSIYTLLPQLESYKTQLSSQVRKLLDNPEEFENPISAYLNTVKKKAIQD